MNGRIFGVMLRAQARYVAPFLALAMFLAVALPLATLQGLGSAELFRGDRTGLLLAQARYLAGAYPVLALCVGIFLAVATWLPDVHWRWVYVLTLPVERSRLALHRLLAGMLLILPVALALWLSGVLAAALADVPSVVRANPGALALRFVAGAAAAFGVGSLAVLAGKRLWLLPLAFIALLVFNVGGLGLNLGVRIVEILFLAPFSPLHALSGQWLLFDV